MSCCPGSTASASKNTNETCLPIPRCGFYGSGKHFDMTNARSCNSLKWLPGQFRPSSRLLEERKSPAALWPSSLYGLQAKVWVYLCLYSSVFVFLCISAKVWLCFDPFGLYGLPANVLVYFCLYFSVFVYLYLGLFICVFGFM